MAGISEGNWGQFSEEEIANLRKKFEEFGRFGDTKFKGDNMTSKNFEKLLKEAKVIGPKMKLTTTDIGIEFKRVCGNKAPQIDWAGFKRVLACLATRANKDKADDELKSIIHKILECCAPGTTNTTAAQKVGGVDRLTDTSKYTGSHKERFDSEGKGKGLAGRECLVDASGYVGNYKGEGSYDKSRPSPK